MAILYLHNLLIFYKNNALCQALLSFTSSPYLSVKQRYGLEQLPLCLGTASSNTRTRFKSFVVLVERLTREPNLPQP